MNIIIGLTIAALIFLAIVKLGWQIEKTQNPWNP